MNIIQQSEQLKDISDDRIAQEMQQPSGLFPLYLVSSEAKRRSDMRARYKTEQAEPPQSTVQQDLLAALAGQQQPVQPPPPQAAPQSAPQAPPQIAPTGQPPMPPQGSPANTGVGNIPQQGFAEGGMVRGFANGTSVRTDPRTVLYRRPTRAGSFGAMYPSIIQQQPGAVVRAVQGSTVPLDRAARALAERAMNPPPMNDTPEGFTVPGGDAAFQGPPEASAPLKGAGSLKWMPNSGDPYGDLGAGGWGAPDTDTGPMAGHLPAGDANLIKVEPEVSEAAGLSVSQAFTPFKHDKELSLIDAPGAPKLDKVPSFGDEVDARLAEAKGPDPYVKFAAMMANRAEEVGDAENKNKWLAVAKAGFSMAGGKSQHAMENIGKGASVGLDDYAKGASAIQARKDKNMAMEIQLTGAQEAHKARQQSAAEAYAKGEIDTVRYNNESKMNKARLESENARINAANRKAEAEFSLDKEKSRAAHQSKELDRQLRLEIQANEQDGNHALAEENNKARMKIAKLNQSTQLEIADMRENGDPTAMKLLKAVDKMPTGTAEEKTAKRRAERLLFKNDTALKHAAAGNKAWDKMLVTMKNDDALPKTSTEWAAVRREFNTMHGQYAALSGTFMLQSMQGAFRPTKGVKQKVQPSAGVKER